MSSSILLVEDDPALSFLIEDRLQTRRLRSIGCAGRRIGARSAALGRL